ncbi:tumor necrosis factor receptor superfamily member 10A-like isoform X2 [Phyllostomus hastatus]|uniref:tumor necrosis factor receptor superfamily member 10A-like isoform X2 n=1 Tax=Phyllostomus hastatus TaxID=9423 RepID=UPI001E680EF1|nr:tumor necrosis factor receptor superfamily member 10A-like isoform X2 [Phyllostomus hastatus]
MAPLGRPRWQPVPGALSEGYGQRALGRASALGSKRGPRPWLWLLLALILVLSGVGCFPLNHIARQDARWNSSQKCQPGFYLSEHSGTCIPCTDGKDFTNHSNTLSSCQLCSECFPDKEVTALCTRTTDTQCRCKPGTFQDDNSPEFCQKCSPGCPAGKVEARPCTPWNDRECVDQESGTQASGKTLVPGVTTSLEPPVTSSPSSGSSQLGITIPVIVVAVLFIGALLCYCYWRTHQGCGVDSNCINRIFHGFSCAPRGPEAQDNARNTFLSRRESPSTPTSEEELEHQEHAEPAGVTEQSPGEAKCLLRPAGAEGSQRKRELLVPANGADSVEKTVLFNSWKPLMRRMGLTDNEIQVAEAQASHPREQVYEMLAMLVNKMGRAISVNTLLDALESLGHRNTKEKIEDYLVASGKYVSVEDAAVS